MAKTVETESYLTVGEAAARLGVGERTIRYWISQRHFPGAKRSGPNQKSPYVIPISDILAFEAKHR